MKIKPINKLSILDRILKATSNSNVPSFSLKISTLAFIFTYNMIDHIED